MKGINYLFLLVFFVMGCMDPKSSIDQTLDCLTDGTGNWIDYTGKAFWKFNKDGTFQYRTTYFNSMSASGKYSIDQPTEIFVKYLRYPPDVVPQDKIIRLNKCNELTVGETTYEKTNEEYF